MKMPASIARPRLNRAYRPSPEALAETRDVILRLTSVRLQQADITNLDEGEACELVELTRKLGRDEHGQPAETNWNRLTLKEARRWEHLIEGAAQDPDRFQRLRREGDTKATLETLARKARMPHRQSWQPSAGTVALLGKDLLAMLDASPPPLWIPHLGVLVFVLAQIENAVALSPGARFEGGGDELTLVLSRQLGLGAAYDPEGQIGGWEKRLRHLATNGWLLVERRGHELHVRRGKRALRAVEASAK